MKKLIYIAACAGAVAFSSCTDNFLDLEPLDAKTDLVYFQTAEQFNEYALGLYNQLIGWQCRYDGIFDHMDCASDLSTYFSNNNDVGTGTIQVAANSGWWDNCYGNIRATNMLFQKAAAYPGSQQDIEQPLGEGYFFRAYTYFYLLQHFGGVPIVTAVLDVDSPELYGSRSSRYDVVEFILSDLDKAIEYLPNEASIPSSDKGRISKGGAKAFKARVLLYEATWRKYNGTSTDFQGSGGPASDQVNDFLDEAVSLCEDVMGDSSYSLWNFNASGEPADEADAAEMENYMSSRYLFNIEDESSNPFGKGKDTNHEFVIYSTYDTQRIAGQEITQTIWKLTASRKLVDMFLCRDGLPVEKSPLFKGYEHRGEEFDNRDYRLASYIGRTDNVALTGGNSGYTSYKFAITSRTVANKDEHHNYPVLRLAEVYLIYAEALFERNGRIEDGQLDRSINLLRDRGGVAHLSNAFVQSNGLDMLTEIRRERTIELYMEGFRYDDLKRWGQMEAELNESRCGMVVGDADFKTDFVDYDGNAIANLYSPNNYVWGTEKVQAGEDVPVTCVVCLGSSEISVDKTDYLWPLPSRQIEMNPNLVQNPGY